METPLVALKPILYDVLRQACKSDNNGDTAVTQNLGVSMTNAMKKDGVNIIQIQNVRMDTIVPPIIKALEIVDQLETYHREIEGQLLELTAIDDDEVLCIEHASEPEPEPEPETIDKLCAEMFSAGKDGRAAVSEFKIRYVDYVAGQLGNTKRALEFLNWSASVYHNAKRGLEAENG